MEDNNSEKQPTQFIEHVDEHAGRVAAFEEQHQTPLQAIKANPKAVLWCWYVIWLLILASFENQAGGAILGIPQFRKDFGYAFGGDYVLPADWQSAFSGGPVATTVIGTLTFGWWADRVGRKWALCTCFLFSIVGITVEVVATTNPIFFVGKLINGFGVGGIIAVALTYIGEVAPTALRGILSSASAIAFTFGPLMVAIITNFTGVYTNRWAYRAVFVSQYGVLAIGMAAWPFMPESPWWLISKGKEAQAAKSLQKLGYSATEVEKRVANIVLTLEEVKRETEGVSFLECFRKSNLRRTMISIAPLSIQALSGVFLMAAYAVYYFQLAGFSTAMSFNLGICQQVVSLAGNACAWFLVDRVGRRDLQFWGLVACTLILIVMGTLAVVGDMGSLKGAAAMIILYGFVYNVTIGATAYTLLTEVATARLRVKTIALGISLQNCIYTFWSFVMPFLFNPDKLNLGAKTAFIFTGLAFFCLVYLWFCQPETAGRTYEEMDEMFAKRVPARKFKGYKTEAEERRERAMATQLNQ